MDQLYMLEIFIEKIRFPPSVIEIPNLQELKFVVIFNHLINLDISLDDIRGFKFEQDPFKRNLNLDLGKSVIFKCKPVDLLSTIEQFPLELHLKSTFALGSVCIPWGPTFFEMVDKSATTINVSPAVVKNTYEVMDENQTKISEIDVLIRLSSYGQNIQTDFQIVPQNKVLGDDRPGNTYFFKDDHASTVFRAQTFGNDNSPGGIPLIAALCEPADSETFIQKEKLKPEDLSTNEINKVLCDNINCPGAQKFAEFGIGPAATGAGLGTLYETTDSTDMPACYGLSNTYGRMENYGPFGLYIRPKAFDGQDDDSTNEYNCGPESITSNDSNCQCCSLRLKGGGTEDDENFRPQPMVMCKDLMQSFDKVLEAYKKAVGPCGQGTCPFAYNILDESCKKFCHGHTSTNLGMTPTQMTVANTPATDPNSVSGCGTPSCPFSRQQSVSAEKSFQLKQLKSACGKPTCPFTKQKLGTATDEDIMEMQFMDGNCKPCASKCPQSMPAPKSLKPLDPIHWDCPDPLPKGPCRNPQCPFKPKELRFIPKSTCNSPSCPYAILPPCGDTNCPFTPAPTTASNASSNNCGDPKCLFVAKPPCPSSVPPCVRPLCFPPPPPCLSVPCPTTPCGPITPCCLNINCPSNPPTCGDPNCPLNLPPKPCPAMTTCQPCPPPPPPCSLPSKPSISRPVSPTSICTNPNCPFNSKMNNSNQCSNPDCPLNQVLPDSTSVCTNPDCPYKKQSSQSFCANPACPLRQLSDALSGSICSNPQCPFANKGSVNENESVCSNPQCPFRQKTSINTKNSLCSNPQCPFRQQPSMGTKDSICSNPQCPFQPSTMTGTKEEKASIITKGTICSNPNCPFSVGMQDNTSICDNPECPFSTKNELEIARPKITVDCTCEKTSSEKFRGSMGAGQDSYGSCPCCTNIASATGMPNQTLPTETTAKKKTGKHKRKSTQYMYKVGDLYPGVHIGHRECIIPGRNVPAKMGWAWNVHVPCVGLKPRRGWRPGAVGRKVAKMIMAHRKAKGLQLLGPLTAKSKKSKSRFGDSDSDVTVAPKATLQVKKREGAYVITMNPLKDPMKIEDNENPYMDCSPLQFKISKNKDKTKDESRLCFCNDQEEESSSDSELDIEFTPPAGIIRPERLKKKKNVVHTDTQYSVNDFGPPKPLSPTGSKGKSAAAKKKKKK